MTSCLSDMNTVRSLILCKRRVHDGFRLSMRRSARRKQRVDLLRTRALMAPAPNVAQLEVILCLPTAPALPIVVRSGDFGTSPFFGQLTDKTSLCPLWPHGGPDVKNNKGREINRVAPASAGRPTRVWLWPNPAVRCTAAIRQLSENNRTVGGRGPDRPR